MAVVEYEKRGHLRVISLNRPEKKNALNGEMMELLKGFWTAFMDDEDAWLAILTGNGDSFSVGVDLSFLGKSPDGTPGLLRWLETLRQDPFFCGKVDKPTIGAISGYCLGGALVMALNTDLRVCAESAKLQIAEVKLGFPLLLRDNLPNAIAAELNGGIGLSGRRAYEVGLVNRVVEDGQVMNAALELAEELLSMAPLGVYHGIRLARELKNTEDRLPSEYMVQLQLQLQESGDFSEALSAIREKRRPQFKRR